jgi:hypothetical protein
MFYRCAHPDLQIKSFLNCDEHISIDGVTPHGALQFSLPQYQLAAFFVDKHGVSSGNTMDLDTLQIDLTTMTASLVWRIAVPRGDGFREIETRMLVQGVSPNGR